MATAARPGALLQPAAVRVSRRRRLVTTMLVVVLLGLLCGLGVYIAGLAPIAGAGPGFAAWPDVQTIEPNFMSGGMPVAVFAYHENETAYWLTGIANTGPVDIRIDGLVPPPAYQSFLVRPVCLRPLPPGAGGGRRRILAFRAL